MGFLYDFHLHSCLSPCGSDEMTPYNLVNLAALMELSAIALTDHNSCKNCPAAAEVAKEAGILLIPGMELNTVEEIHLVCLFPDLERAMAFDRKIEPTILPIENDPEIFGRQLRMDAADNILGEEPVLLISASSVSIMDAPAMVSELGGICFPAHIDKSAYSVLSVLGSVPPECGFAAYETTARADMDALFGLHPDLRGMRRLINSDAHSLEDIGAGGGFLDCAPEVPAIFRLLGEAAK